MPPQSSALTLFGGTAPVATRGRARCGGERSGRGGPSHRAPADSTPGHGVPRRTGVRVRTQTTPGVVKQLPPLRPGAEHVGCRHTIPFKSTSARASSRQTTGEETSKLGAGLGMQGPQLTLSAGDRTRLLRPLGPERALPQGRRRTAAPLHCPGWPDRKLSLNGPEQSQRALHLTAETPLGLPCTQPTPPEKPPPTESFGPSAAPTRLDHRLSEQTESPARAGHARTPAPAHTTSFRPQASRRALSPCPWEHSMDSRH